MHMQNQINSGELADGSKATIGWWEKIIHQRRYKKFKVRLGETEVTVTTAFIPNWWWLIPGLLTCGYLFRGRHYGTFWGEAVGNALDEADDLTVRAGGERVFDTGPDKAPPQIQGVPNRIASIWYGRTYYEHAVGVATRTLQGAAESTRIAGQPQKWEFRDNIKDNP